MNAVRQAAVSSPAESLILVDEHDCEIGFRSKEECHRGEGLLHRAFSVFLFNHEGKLLLQKRSGEKPLWPLYWSNSCCSHPREAETVEDAVYRRVREELNLECELQFLYKFKYQASFGDVGAEHEFCWVYAGQLQGSVVAHPEEIAGWRFVDPDELTRAIEKDGDRYTPWLKMEWQQIRQDHLEGILAGIS